MQRVHAPDVDVHTAFVQRVHIETPGLIGECAPPPQGQPLPFFPETRTINLGSLPDGHYDVEWWFNVVGMQSLRARSSFTIASGALVADVPLMSHGAELLLASLLAIAAIFALRRG